MKKKIFDCVKMKDQAQQKIYKITKNFSDKELLDFWNEKYKSAASKVSQHKNIDTKKYSCIKKKSEMQHE